MKLLQEVEASGGVASTEQRQALARWSGWGAAAGVFDRHHKLGKRFLPELEDLLDKREIAAARQSTLNAHYTSPLIAEAIWETATSLGFRGGDVIEPGCGPGVFFAAAPGDRPVRMTGVELDPTTARICSAAHPEHTVVTAAMQSYRGKGFGLAVGNVPFADVTVRDATISGKNAPMALHNYCLAKSLSALAPGGLLIAVTSRYTMDAISPAQRKQLSRWGKFLGAVRLPAETFQSHSGTSVVTDIVAFQRRPEPLDLEGLPAEGWWRTAEHVTEDGTEYRRNRWYDLNPDLVLGTVETGGLYGGDEITLTSDADLTKAIPAALNKLARRVYLPYPTPDVDTVATRTATDAHPRFHPPHWAREGSIFADGSGFVQIREGLPTQYTRRLDPRPKELANASRREKAAELKRRQAAAVTQLRAMCHLRDVARDLIAAEKEHSDTADDLRAELNAAYDTATAAIGGTLIDRDKAGNMRRRLFGGFVDDPDCVFLMGLETEGSDGPEKGPAFSRRITRPVPAPTDVASLRDAVVQSVGRLGRVDIDFMRSVTPDLAWSPDDLIDQGLAYRDPALAGHDTADKRWIAAPLYLSGDVRAKHATAEAAAADPKYQANVAALTEVLPKYVPASEITVNCGTTMLTPAEVSEMILSTLGKVNNLNVSWSESGGWGIRGDAPSAWLRYHTEWGTSEVNAVRVLDAAWSGRQIQVKKPDPNDPEGKKRILDVAATVAAAEKVDKWHSRLVEWMFDDDTDRSAEMARRWNEKYNRFVAPQFPDEWMSNPPGLSEEFQRLGLYKHQSTAAARIALGDDFLLGHCVGAGKTVAMATGVMEMRRLGVRSKPVVVVPNSVVTQFGVEFLRAFPDAAVLTPPKGESPKKADRQAFASKALWGDWDAVIIPHSFFERIPLRPDTVHRHMEGRLQELREDLERENDQRAKEGYRDNKTTSGEQRSKRTIKQIEKQVARAKEHMAALTDAEKDDDVFWEDFGFDYLLVDEAHEFKNLAIKSANREDSFRGVKKAEDLLIKIEVLRRLYPDRGVVTLATGTPVSNKPSELWVMGRFLAPDLLRAAGAYNFDSWAAAYTVKATRLEPAPVGHGFAPRTRVAAYCNVPELRALIDARGDIRTADDLGLARPALKGGTKEERYAKPSPLLNGWMDSLADRAVNSNDDKDAVIALISSARRAALDMSLVGVPVDPDRPSKLFSAASDIADYYHETKDRTYPGSDKKGTLQLVFCDLGTPKPDQPSAYGTLRDALAERGVPTGRVEMIHDYDSAAEKNELFSRCREGDVSVVVGSTQKMGMGVNIQDRLGIVWHLTLPWKPAEIEQREGRIRRPGNLNPEVEVVYYVAEGSSDVMQLCLLENKHRFITQFVEARERVVDACTTDEKSISYQQMMAFATGDSRALDMARLEGEVANLRRSRSSHRTEVRRAEQMNDLLTGRLRRYREADTEHGGYTNVSPEASHLSPGGRPLDRSEAQKQYALGLYDLWRGRYSADRRVVGQVGDVPVWARCGDRAIFLGAGPPGAGATSTIGYSDMFAAHSHAIGDDTYRSIPDLHRRYINLVKRLPAEMAKVRRWIPETEEELERGERTVGRTWPHHERLLELETELETIRNEINENPIERELPDEPINSRLIAEVAAQGGDVMPILHPELYADPAPTVADNEDTRIGRGPYLSL